MGGNLLRGRLRKARDPGSQTKHLTCHRGRDKRPLLLCFPDFLVPHEGKKIPQVITFFPLPMEFFSTMK
jgi:hypothetical protein